MSATPIPRSLALAFFGEFDVSVIDELPAGRKAITTKIIDHKEWIKLAPWLRQKTVSYTHLIKLLSYELQTIQPLPTSKPVSTSRNIDRIYPIYSEILGISPSWIARNMRKAI